MLSRKFVERRSLFADVSFADLWRAVRYRQSGGLQALPGALEVAHASRFAAQSQLLASDAAAEAPRASDLRQAA